MNWKHSCVFVHYKSMYTHKIYSVTDKIYFGSHPVKVRVRYGVLSTSEPSGVEGNEVDY